MQKKVIRKIVSAFVLVVFSTVEGKDTGSNRFDWPLKSVSIKYQYAGAIRKLAEGYGKLLHEGDAASNILRAIEQQQDQDELDAHLAGSGLRV